MANKQVYIPNLVINELSEGLKDKLVEHLKTNSNVVTTDITGGLSSLQTTAKDNLVGAINENFSNIQVNKTSINNIKGQISTTNNNIGNLQNLTTTNKSNIVSAINEVNTTTSKLLTSNLEWSVGTGGDYTTLQDALEEASKYLSVGNSTITLMLKADYSSSLNVSLNNVNIGFVNIDAEADLKSKQFKFNFINSVCPKFNNKIKVILIVYNCSIYLTDEVTLDAGTVIIASNFVNISTVNILCVSKSGSAILQCIIFDRSQVQIATLIQTFYEEGTGTGMTYGFVAWHCLMLIQNFKVVNNINRNFCSIWNVGSNLEIANFSANISSNINLPNCFIISQERSGFTAVQRQCTITGGSSNVIAFYIHSGNIIFKSGVNPNVGNCTKSNIASNTLTADGGFINR